ncbi:uncharacterized protein C11orf42 homolog [Alligator mississippiensis]|uniref:uncharacterized protein C11orf42 homolog n=1 Tax=Alligator mississippiensis TaxID=8496 RepID=UPI002877A811|nr:uncharacterized protein C11orf42 homolog [Alligator mississippiensis]
MADGGPPVLDPAEADAHWALIRDKVGWGEAGTGRGPPCPGQGHPGSRAPPQVAEQHLGAAAVATRALWAAGTAPYDLLAVLVKRGPWVPGRARALGPAGWLDKLAVRGAEALAGRGPARGPQAEARYEETRLVAGVPRQVAVVLAGARREAVPETALEPGCVALWPDLPWLRAQRSIYVVHQVLRCTSLVLTVMQDGVARSRRLARPGPLAFTCLKLALGPDGVLGPQKPLGRALPARLAWALPPARTEPPEPRLRTWWPRRRRREPDRHSMSLPLLQSLAADSDSDP